MIVKVYRIGRAPEPWQYPDWSRANPDRTFGNRFDDPNGEYRVLYASSARLGCFLETLARYRPDLSVYAELAEIEGPDDFTGPEIMPVEWLRGRSMGSARAEGDFADVCGSEWLSILRRRLAPWCIRLGIEEFDASTMQRTAPRLLTQQVSAIVYQQGLNGIRYLSKHGHDIENWALFEPANLSDQNAKTIDPADPDLLAALRVFHLKLG